MNRRKLFMFGAAAAISPMLPALPVVDDTTSILTDLSLRADGTRAMFSGELIVDGAITATKIAAGTIKASSILATTISSRELAI